MTRTSSRPDKVYRSKIDVWMFAIIAAVLAALAIGMIAALAMGDWMYVAQRFFVTLGVAGFIVWITIGTTYTLRARDLVVSAGPMRWTIAIDQISGVAQSHGLFSLRASPALSMDRLEISYGKGRRLMVSPTDKTAFMKDIAARGGKV